MFSEDEDISLEQSQILTGKKKNLRLLESDDDEDEIYSSCSENDLSQDISQGNKSNSYDEDIVNAQSSSKSSKSSGSIIEDSQQSPSKIVSRSPVNKSLDKTQNISLQTSTPTDRTKKRGKSYFNNKFNESNKVSSDVIVIEETTSSDEERLRELQKGANIPKGKSFTTPQRTKSLSSSDSDEESQIVFNRKKNLKILESDEEAVPGRRREEISSLSMNTDLNRKSQNFEIDTNKNVGNPQRKSEESISKMKGKSFTTPQRTKNLSLSDSDDESQIFFRKKNTSKIESDEDESDSETHSKYNRPRVSNDRSGRLKMNTNKNMDSPRESGHTPYTSGMKGKSFKTPQETKKISFSDSYEASKGRIISTESDEESQNFVISDDDESDIIDPSFTDESLDTSNIKKTPNIPTRTLNQPTLENFVQKMSLNTEEKASDGQIRCKRTEYKQQIEKIQEYEQEMRKAKNLLSTIKLASLPDKGQLLRERFEDFKKNFLDAQEKLKKMVVIEEDLPQPQVTGRAALTENWNNLEAGMAVVQPKTFGKKGLQQHNIQRALTADALEQLHGSLKNCPNDENLEEDPAALKIPLMHHQKRALKWMIYRESQKPSGGILADDMGLGKTLTMISLIVKSAEHKDNDDDDSDLKKHQKFKGGTLVVCPASLLHQWGQEIETKLKRGTLSYYIYHGPKRESKPKRLAENDVVITTYSIAMNEAEKNGAIFRIRWKRIILDEAHQIRNHKAQTSIACCQLSGISRWALTGTPVHNKELDMYALLKFLRCSPFDDLAVWKRWVGDKGSGGGERLHTVISSLMLRRTKVELIQAGKLASLPTKKYELNLVTLDESEMDLYHKVLIFSQKLFAQFLHQRAEKHHDMDIKIPNDANSEYLKMRQKLLKLNRLKEVSQHEILVLLLRLRQICCHPSLIINMLQGDEDLGDDDGAKTDELNLLEQLKKLHLEDHEPDDAEKHGLNMREEGVAFNEAVKNILSPSHPIFARDRMSSKIKSVMELVPNILAGGDKIVMVSQWRSYLELVGIHLKHAGIKFLQFDGSVVTAKRNEITTAFNDSKSRVKVLLLSLTAGGVGLNLVGGNHLFLLDLHWNPQLESQAQDRIYRMGQKKDVYVYKFMTSNTIEERIQKLQENKLAIAENMISGTKQVIANKLSLQDLKMLFNM